MLNLELNVIVIGIEKRRMLENAKDAEEVAEEKPAIKLDTNSFRTAALLRVIEVDEEFLANPELDWGVGKNVLAALAYTSKIAAKCK